MLFINPFQADVHRHIRSLIQSGQYQEVVRVKEVLINPSKIMPAHDLIS